MGGGRHNENDSRVATRSPGYSTGLITTPVLAAFALDTAFGAAHVGSPVHRFDMAAVLLPLALEADNMAVAAGSKAAAVAAVAGSKVAAVEIES